MPTYSKMQTIRVITDLSEEILKSRKAWKDFFFSLGNK
jgi:hypothetical protein